MLAVAVVVPARDEESLIAACLEAIQTSAEAATEALGRAAPPVTIVVVADGCVDSTATIAGGFDGVHVVTVTVSNVGAARAAGIRHALTVANLPPESVWIANTDADSLVPVEWITHQLHLAGRATGMMVGTVRPDFGDLSPAQIDAWTARHTPGRANGHVHGANLGLRADLYLAAGGFAELPEHEDVHLARRVRELGALVVASDQCEVLTSGRAIGRTPGGYARYLSMELHRSKPAPAARSERSEARTVLPTVG